MDSLNITIAIVGYVIVFSALVLLYLIFQSIPKLLNMNFRKRMRQKGEECEDCETYIPAEVSVAIGMALYMNFNAAHDIESTKMTIKKVSKTYSPWSSKIYGLNNTVTKRKFG
ncbi:MAG: OadG family protein [Bacteroidota bacterium]|nr:OadG family protein [Bacteroidota bacterium]